jgi:serine protease AprX
VCRSPGLQTVVANVRQAGIVVVAAAGNSGPSCSSISHPPAIYDESLTVGATNNLDDSITSFSSRGPVTIDGSNRLKPDVTAPGSNVRSSIPPNGYSYKSGTSMATPHVTGLVALLLQARPDMRGNVEAIELLLREAIP